MPCRPISTKDPPQTSHNHTFTTDTAAAHSHTVDIPTFATDSTGDESVDVTMPYVQLLACRKD